MIPFGVGNDCGHIFAMVAISNYQTMPANLLEMISCMQVSINNGAMQFPV